MNDAPPAQDASEPGSPAISLEEQIASLHLFAGLRTEALNLMAHVVNEEIHPLGAVIFRHGDPGDKMYLVLEGRVRISRELQGAGEEALAIVGPGEVFGEMALLDDSPRSADARVHDRCKLLAIRRDAFEDLLYIHKDLAYEVLWNVIRLLTRRLRETNDRFAMLSLASKF